MGRFSVITFYVLAATAVFLPFLIPGPEVAFARWVIFSFVSAVWLMFNLQWWTRLVIRPWLCVSLVLIVSWLLASALWSEDPPYTVARAISLALLFVLLLVLTARIVREHHESLVLHLITIHGMVLFVPGLILWGSGMTYVPWSFRSVLVSGRYAGILWNPNQIALCGIIMFPLAFALWWEKKRRIWMLGVLAVIFVSIYLSQSRNGLLSLMLGIVVFFAVRYKLKWMFPAGIAAALLCFFVYHASDKVQSGVARFIVRKEYATADEISIAKAGESRFMVWEPIMEDIKKRPWLGSGYGTGGAELRRHYQGHNSYLQIVQETGFIGLAIILPVLLSLLYVLFKISVLHAPLPDRALWSGIAATVAAGLANATFESWLLALGNLGTLPFWLCAFLLLSRIQKRKKKRGR